MNSQSQIDQRDTLLRSNVIGAFLDLDGHESISKFASRQFYPLGTELFKQGFTSEGVFWIESGLVKRVHLNQEGRESLAGLRSKGWLLGAVEVVVRRLSLVSAVGLLSFTRNKSEFSWHLHQQQSRENSDQVAQLVSLGSSLARPQLEQLLLQLVSFLDPKEFQKRPRQRLSLKHYEIAELIVSTPQHQSRLLKQMRQE